jgi:hypothetical protein
MSCIEGELCLKFVERIESLRELLGETLPGGH